ncbi:MAG: TIGR03960 family B12-binding radical SAM protein [Clostridiales Family XIII bacterium]|nr:TIGR03960 family B12-binding radical SAM protein [Clostridia bacterium]MDY3011603.1 TIGR03960 family B12-binding radical SAM protein [Clostridiales Family XIII bacterium]
MEISKELDKLLKQVEKPARYIGGEINAVIKDPQQVRYRFGFAFPDTYEIGMSYMGMQILYHILNKKADIYCERVFAPAMDMEKLMRNNGMELFTLETKTPLKELDFLGFTLQYELSFTNLLNMLSLAKIPLLAEERDDSFPIILAGGPCAYNPEPLAEIVDAFLIGDGEELLPQVVKMKEDEQTKEDYLKAICKLPGVYVPRFYEPVYDENGTIKEIVKTYEGAPDRIERALIADLDKAFFPEEPIVPLIEVVHDRAVVETFRGCTRGCRFCQAGMIYRPVREREPETIKEIVKHQLDNTGHEELSLLSLSTSDYSRFEELALDLMAMCKEQNVSLSLPSLRLDSFFFNVLQEIQGYKKSGLTFAPEAGSQRLRDVINKGITEEDIYGAVRQALELGWSNVKLYFMIGLPTETYEDLDGIAEIARKIKAINYEVKGRKGGRFNVTVSVSNFVPKAHTPFQWEAQDTEESFFKKHDYLTKQLTMKGVTFNYHDTEVSALEAVFARGDRRVSRALIRAFELGCKFDGWSEHFRGGLWKQAFSETGIDPAFYTTRARSYDEILPWDRIDCFVTREFLIQENEKAKAETTTQDCRKGCAGCGMNRKANCMPEVNQ